MCNGIKSFLNTDNEMYRGPKFMILHCSPEPARDVRNLPHLIIRGFPDISISRIVTFGRILKNATYLF